MRTPIIGISSDIQRIRDLIDRVSNTDSNIVISGESGVGKELVARELYLKSNKNGKPFVKINCSAVPEKLLESDLFGGNGGASSRLELARNSVLMLDEVGGLSPALQAKILHLLQSGEFSPRDSEKKIKTNAWIIATTNQNLGQDDKHNKLRADSASRLNFIWIYIPPLRHRPEDILPLFDFYVSRYSDLVKIDFKIPPSELIRIKSYSWPGNVREIQDVLARMIVLGSCKQVLDQLDYSRRPIADI